MKQSKSLTQIQDLLEGKNLEFDTTPDKSKKLIRHADSRINQHGKNKGLLIGGKPVPKKYTGLRELYYDDIELFNLYQSEQPTGSFDGIKYLVVFLGEKNTLSRFIGVYKIENIERCPYYRGHDLLTLRKLTEFNSLEEKVIIDWGGGVRAWKQNYKNEKYVIEIEDNETVSIPSI